VAWHVLSSTYFDFERFERDSGADRSPSHGLPVIADRLGAAIHQPLAGDTPPGLVDRLGSVVYGQPMHWELARRVAPMLADGDAVYAAGCDGGVPLALWSAVRRRRVAFAISFIDVGRRRTQLVGWLLVLLRVRLLLIVPTDLQAERARAGFGRRAEGIHTIDGQTDTSFFRPPDTRPVNDPPLAAGSGVEQRDYLTMAQALGGEEVTVEVCFASPNRTDKTRYTMPEPVPANMDFRWFDFSELRDLYQRADVMVLSLRPNRYSAGLTTLFEAIACEAPVVVTESPGIIDRLIEEDLVVGVPPGDPEALRKAVDEVIGDPQASRERALRARRVLLDRYSATSFHDRLDGLLRRFADG
jgi:hypothetical protein